MTQPSPSKRRRPSEATHAVSGAPAGGSHVEQAATGSTIHEPIPGHNDLSSAAPPGLAAYRISQTDEPASKRMRTLQNGQEEKGVSPKSDSGSATAGGAAAAGGKPADLSYFPPAGPLQTSEAAATSNGSGAEGSSEAHGSATSSGAPLPQKSNTSASTMPPGRKRTTDSPYKYGPHRSPALPSPGLSSFAGVFKRPKMASSSHSTGSDTRVVPGDELRLEGYRDVRVISRHYDDVVACRAISTARDDRRVLLKFSLLARPSVAGQFKSEVLLLNRLRDAGINNVSKPIAREHGRYGAMIVAVDEDLHFWAESYFAQRQGPPHWTQPEALIEAIERSIGLVGLLNSIHDLGLVHGSIRPTTISTSPAGEVFLHDFSCSFTSSGTAENGGTAPTRERGMKEESLPYLAPEASGRVGNVADYRSDYYSVGCSLYELYTGRVPFADALDPLEILHAHIAKRPSLMSAIDPSIPHGLSLIVAKLLEKNLEARYQTGQGIVVDLERIASLVRAASANLPSSAVDIAQRMGRVGLDFVPGVIDEIAHIRLPPATQLFGREEHVRQLRASFEQVKQTNCSAVVIVKGSSGIGKTSLIETLRAPAVACRGHYIMSKFDQIKSPVPFFAVTQALSGLFRQLLAAPEVQLVVWRRRLSRAIASEGRILFDILPFVEQLFEPGWLAEQPAVPVLSPQESEERMRVLMQRLLRAFSRAGKPLVLVFDDLQWSSAADVAFIRSLAALGAEEGADPSVCKMANPMLLLCVYRDNEVGPEHLISTELLPQLPTIDCTLTLAPLDLASVTAFVAAALHQPPQGTIRRLSDLVLARTGGSPLFVAQLLKAFYLDGSFTFDYATEQWTFDLDELAQKTISADVVELLFAQMHRYSKRTQSALQVAACLGNEELDADQLAVAAGYSPFELARDLRGAVQDGLLLAFETQALSTEPTSRRPSTIPERYRFFHDRCQQAAYALIPPDSRAALHYAVGQRLAAALSEEQVREQVFELVQQLNHGVQILRTTEERDTLARFNYLAGKRAAASTAYEAAQQYLLTAVDLLGGGAWTEQHALMSKVVELLIEVEYSLTDYPAVQGYVRTFLQHADNQVAKLRTYVHSIRSAAAVGDSARAIEIGRQALASAGYRLPDTTEEAECIVQEIRKRLALTADQLDDLVRAPVLQDPVAAGCQAILAALVPPVYFVRIDLLGALSSLSLDLSVAHGLDHSGAFVLTLHAILVRSRFCENAESFAYGRAAIAFFERTEGSPLACPTYKVYSSHVAIWALPIEAVLSTFRKSISYGIQYRDAEYLGFGTGECCAYSMLFRGNLEELQSDLERYAVLVRKYRHELSSTYIGVVQQTVLCLTGRALDPCEVEGEAFSAADLQICRERKYSLTLLLTHTFRLLLATIHRDTARVEDAIRLGKEHLAGGQGLIFPVFFQLFEAIHLSKRFATTTPEEKATLEATRRMLAELARSQPDNFRPLQVWLEAAHAVATLPAADALNELDAAIEIVTKSGFSYVAAYLNEDVASLLANPKLAVGYLFEAHAQWQRWGCKPKVALIEQRYPAYFPSRTAAPIATSSASTPALLTAHSVAPDWLGNRATDPGVTAQPLPPLKHRRSSTPSHETRSQSDSVDVDLLSQGRSTLSEFGPKSLLATELDLRTVVTASSVISSEISVDGVVSKLLKLALRMAGAESCLLVLDKGGVLCAEAVARSDRSEVEHLRRLDPIDLSPDRYPCGVINYTARTQSLILNSVSAETVHDSYLEERKPKSILSLALASQQRVIGVLYMENAQTSNAFTPDRLEILSLISGQAAATIEKARLVQDLKKTNDDLTASQRAIETANRNLENKIAERTAQLRDQNRLLEAEVAQKEHAQAEMREAKDVAEAATAMKSQFLANMSHEIRTPFNAVVALSGLLLDTVLTPVQTDYVETIKNSAQELLVVLNDILDYSKIELDHLELSFEPVQLRAVLESCLDMVAERAATKSIELALVIEEGDISVMGDLARLRQVGVNLLSNAVKFTSEGEVTVTAFSRPAEPDEDGRPRRWCTVAVKDTGIGIAKDKFGRLFRVFSQAEGAETSRTFGGTGLGLAISRKLARLMDGDLVVDSTLGEGSTFTFEWLATSVTRTEHDPYAPSANPDLARKRALVIDENLTSRTVLRQLLTSFGLIADVHADVNDAYSMAVDAAKDGQPYDLVIVDAFLPSFGAQLLLRRLRQNGMDFPAIALTRMGSPIHDGMRQLDCRFLIKPLKRNRLHHTLRAVFPAGEISRVASPAPSAPAFPATLATRNPLSILVAEDNPVNVKVITHLLKRMGYSCDVAEDGLVATEKAGKKRYDLILMDLNMPRMDGLEATRTILANAESGAHRPYIVCLTANAMTEDRARCLDAGADGYVSKPILVPDLVSALNDAGAKRATVYGPVPVPLANLGGGGASPGGFELSSLRIGRAARKAGSLSGRSNTSSNTGGQGSGPPSPSPEAGREEPSKLGQSPTPPALD
ncbi:hypothetical protein JCM10908_001168 [Rhodotorula pacifica]|uniref:uncharacterized protein n=1 Tax=Rhodotorula pacifica TaxID=1495444 RepID=UPI0031757E90